MSQTATADRADRVRLTGPSDLLAAIPHMLGFHPENSLVVLGMTQPRARVRLAFRYDLPAVGDNAAATGIGEHVLAVLVREHAEMVVLVGYGEARDITATMDVVIPAIRAADIAVSEALRVEAGRYWSYVCREVTCCPPDGVPYRPAGDAPVSQQLIARGLTVLPDRRALEATLARDPASVQPVADALPVADAEIFDADWNADLGRAVVADAVGRYRQGGRITDYAEFARLGLWLNDLRVRDDAWARMEPEFAEQHRALWTDLLRCMPPELTPAPASLLGFVAWQAGDGALAVIAIDRALEANPAYTMADLLSTALHAGLPPSAARTGLTPEQVAASYSRQSEEPA